MPVVCLAQALGPLLPRRTPAPSAGGSGELLRVLPRLHLAPRPRQHGHRRPRPLWRRRQAPLASALLGLCAALRLRPFRLSGSRPGPQGQKGKVLPPPLGRLPQRLHLRIHRRTQPARQPLARPHPGGGQSTRTWDHSSPVPPLSPCRSVAVRLFAEHFEVLDSHHQIVFSRRYAPEADKGKLIIDPTHYATLKRRPATRAHQRLAEAFLQRFPSLAPLLSGLQLRMKALAPLHFRALLRLVEAPGEKA